jgi:nitrogen fixation NifU-like protein
VSENTQYSQKVMDHFLHPHNVGDLPEANGIGNVGNPVCGDIMRLYIKVENGRIVDARFKTFGCGAAIATSSMVTDLVKGKTIEEALEISNQAVAEALGGLPKVKMHCSVLAEEALRAAIEDYRKKEPKA